MNQRMTRDSAGISLGRLVDVLLPLALFRTKAFDLSDQVGQCLVVRSPLVSTDRQVETVSLVLDRIGRLLEIEAALPEFETRALDPEGELGWESMTTGQGER